MNPSTDVDGKAYVHWKAWREAYDGLLDHNWLFSRTLEFCRERAERASRIGVNTFVALDRNRVVGFCDYGPYRGNDLPDAGEIYAIYVLRSYYGQALGFTLMDSAVHELAGFTQVALWVLANNERAIRFYERYGFRPDGAQQTLIDLVPPSMELRLVLPGTGHSPARHL